MSGIQLIQQVVLVVFALNALLMLAMIILKAVHRYRMTRHDRRYSAHLALLSRHLTYDKCTDPIEEKSVLQRAFLDALIDVRNTVVGPEIQRVMSVVDRHGVVDRLGSALRSRGPRVRRLRAAVALAELGDESSAQLLMHHVDDADPEVRVQAARGLGRMQWTPAIDSIVERLGMEEPWVRSRFADTLVGFGAKATWPLAVYIKVNHRHEIAGSVAAIQALAAVGDEEAVVPILHVLDDAPDAEVAINAIEALGALGGSIVAEPLRAAANGDDWRIRAKAVTALGEIGDTEALPILADRLTDQNFWVRRNSASALAHVPGGTEELLAALDGEDAYAADAALEALVDRGDLSAARQRVREGTATESDFKLLSVVDEDKWVSA